MCSVSVDGVSTTSALTFCQAAPKATIATIARALEEKAVQVPRPAQDL